MWFINQKSLAISSESRMNIPFKSTVGRSFLILFDLVRFLAFEDWAGFEFELGWIFDIWPPRDWAFSNCLKQILQKCPFGSLLISPATRSIPYSSLKSSSILNNSYSQSPRMVWKSKESVMRHSFMREWTFVLEKGHQGSSDERTTPGRTCMKWSGWQWWGRARVMEMFSSSWYIIGWEFNLDPGWY